MYAPDWSDARAAMSAAVHAADERYDMSGMMRDPMGGAVPLTEAAADQAQEPYEPGDQGEPPYMTGDTY